jgi:hypothetical protein
MGKQMGNQPIDNHPEARGGGNPTRGPKAGITKPVGQQSGNKVPNCADRSQETRARGLKPQS